MPAENEKPSVKLSLPLVSITSLVGLSEGADFTPARNINKTSSMSSARTMN